MDVDSEDASDSPTPVTVLTGALGAGKTTLLRYILEKPHGYRVAVIQNEFSEEMGIESPLITDANGEGFKDIVELPNGCLCCSAKNGFTAALDNLLADKKRFDYVVVEATGVADPESICEIFWVDDGLGSKVYLDGVITLVDCRNALSALGDKAACSAGLGDAQGLGLEVESAKQIACADVLVLNKVDLVPDASARATVAQRISTMNPTAILLSTTRSAVSLGDILGIKAFDRSRLAKSIESLGELDDGHATCQVEGCTGEHGDVDVDGHGHGHGHSHSHGDGHGHIRAPLHGIESLLVRGTSQSALYDPTKINAWLADVLWEGSAGGVFRCKGLFKGPPEEDQEQERVAVYALQAVGKIFEVEEVQCNLENVQSKRLFIGRGLDRKKLEEGWQKCVVSAG